MNLPQLYLTECPRDAMQGIKDFIPTQLKIDYLNQLLRVGFDCIDFGSFVSPKAIPQLQDTKEVLKELDFENSKSKLLAIVANKRGAEEAALFDKINYLGFPLSVSEIFQYRNTNITIAQALKVVEEIHSICRVNKKQLVVYLSMSFGNPYHEEYDVMKVLDLAKKLSDLGITHIVPSDTIGAANERQIAELGKILFSTLPNIQWGLHLHSNPFYSAEKIKASFDAGFYRIDSSIRGYGGCPMATDELTGNLATERLVEYCQAHQIEFKLNRQAFDKAILMAEQIFNNYH